MRTHIVHAMLAGELRFEELPNGSGVDVAQAVYASSCNHIMRLEKAILA